MSIFGSIMSKIFGHGAEAATPATGIAQDNQQAAAAGPSATDRAGGAGGAPMQTVDVEKVLTEMAAKSGQPSNWQQSIVDLMKLLGLDSSLAARKELAGELHYTGSTDDSATMNVWLHKQVMQKLAENGGKVPDSLKN
jgi:hypothetical protein